MKSKLEIQKRKLLCGVPENGLYAGKPMVIIENGECREAKEIGRHEVLCQQDTSYNGCLLDGVYTYETPWGVWERSYSAWGGGLEHSDISYRIIGSEELQVAAAEATATSLAAIAAADKLRMFSSATGNLADSPKGAGIKSA